jgi:hypothetical protein
MQCEELKNCVFSIVRVFLSQHSISEYNLSQATVIYWQPCSQPTFQKEIVKLFGYHDRTILHLNDSKFSYLSIAYPFLSKWKLVTFLIWACDTSKNDTKYPNNS